MGRVELQMRQWNEVSIYRDPQKDRKWHLYFLNQETNKNHRLALRRSDDEHQDPAAGASEDLLTGNEDLHGKRNPHGFSSQDEVGSRSVKTK